MYIPKLYTNKDLEEVRDFIRQNGFAILVNQANDKLWATHIPLVLDKNAHGKEILHGHIAKANPQWQHFEAGREVMAIFNGPHAYISSSWYDHENVPTWNYIAVHVYGIIQILDQAGLVRHLKKLVDKYEQHSEHPVSVDTMSDKLMDDHLGGLVGFEIEITDIQPAYKLSQNRHQKDHDNIIHELKKTNDENAIKTAEAMQHNKSKK
jgi:transcriptional regulator